MGDQSTDSGCGDMDDEGVVVGGRGRAVWGRRRSGRRARDKPQTGPDTAPYRVLRPALAIHLLLVRAISLYGVHSSTVWAELLVLLYPDCMHKALTNISYRVLNHLVPYDLRSSSPRHHLFASCRGGLSTTRYIHCTVSYVSSNRQTKTY